MKMNEMKRIVANDPVALVEHGKELYQNEDFDGAFKYYIMAELNWVMWKLTIIYHSCIGRGTVLR